MNSRLGLTLLGVGSAALLGACHSDCEITLQIQATVHAPVSAALTAAELRVTYETCGGLNGDCSEQTLFSQSLLYGSSITSSFVVDFTGPASGSVGDIEQLRSLIQLNGSSLPYGMCQLLPQTEPSIEPDEGADLIVYRFSGTYGSTQCF